MPDSRSAVFGNNATQVTRRCGIFDPAPLLRDCKLTVCSGLPGTRRCVEPARVPADQHVQPARQNFGFTLEFIAQRHQTERRMVAIGIHNTLILRGHKGIPCGIFTCINICHRPFRLNHNALDIRSREGSLRRTPRMETNMIESVGFFNLIDLAPGFHIGRRIAGQWEDGTFQRAAQKDRPAIQRELGPLPGELPHAELHNIGFRVQGSGFRADSETRLQVVEVGREFIPQFRIGTELNIKLRTTAFLIPFDQCITKRGSSFLPRLNPEN